MIDDFKSPARRKPKVIEPLSGPTTPDLSILDEPLSEDTPQPSSFTPDTPLQAAASVPAVADSSSADGAGIDAASEDDTEDSAAVPEEAVPDKPEPPQKRFGIAWPPSKRAKIISSVVAIIIAFGIGALITHFHHTKPALADTVKKPAVAKKVTKPKIIYSNLSGLPVADDSVNQRPVTAVMIENSLDARPQSGLDQAGVVFEALAEGGVTRFMALFQDTQPDYIGPVRSARPYYIQWALGFDAGYAHVGGSPDGLADIKAWSARDLDQFYNSGAYHRISSRYAPHNVYTSISSLNQVEQKKGYTSSTFTGFTRKEDKPYKAPVKDASGQLPKGADVRTPASSISLTFSGYYYDSQFDYDAGTNTYKRSEAGKPHMETDSAGKQTQISPKVVVAMVVPMVRGALDSSGAYYSNYNPVGSGQADVFQDGTVTSVTWNKAGNNAPLTFTDASGQPFQLNRGQTWISAITASNNVSYK